MPTLLLVSSADKVAPGETRLAFLPLSLAGPHACHGPSQRRPAHSPGAHRTNPRDLALMPHGIRTGLCHLLLRAHPFLSRFLPLHTLEVYAKPMAKSCCFGELTLSSLSRVRNSIVHPGTPCVMDGTELSTTPCLTQEMKQLHLCKLH